jgi:hypothetical protein
MATGLQELKTADDDHQVGRQQFPAAAGQVRCLERTRNLLADEAVWIEPVSDPNSLLTGIFQNFGGIRRCWLSMSAKSQSLRAEFPARLNKEFFNTYQGIDHGA